MHDFFSYVYWLFSATFSGCFIKSIGIKTDNNVDKKVGKNIGFFTINIDNRWNSVA